MDEKKEQLYIPLNVRKRKELFAGFGSTELCVTAIIVVVGFVLGIVFYLIKGEIFYLIGIPLILGIITIVCVIKDQTNTSFVDSVKELLQFLKSQKRYYFSYKNIYEKEF